MAVYGSGIDGEIDAASALLEPDELLRWLAARGEPSAATVDALVAVQRRREEALADEELGHMLGGEMALLLGQVLIASIDGAHWHVWPNGHPVVRIGRTDLDVTEIADAYLCRQGHLRARSSSATAEPAGERTGRVVRAADRRWCMTGW
ncbi:MULTISPECIES: DUF6278 family protein [Rhodococcus]|uniref:DUF6278 family protein n=1 Tax=Rhodococcus rhodochrous TaxID=1829 RepID=A0AA46X1Q5_RHORH|nr:DUF6278 family protein [Rhodococcus rhodochrous]MCB8914072.1 hypothetical protein [Rhodococcus rhodochrous]UZF48002.1 DUF6278 family protein [Rhodococcus rhodochrous]